MEKEPPSRNSNLTLHHSNVDNNKTDSDDLAIKSIEASEMPVNKGEPEKSGVLGSSSAPNSPQFDSSHFSSLTLSGDGPNNVQDPRNVQDSQSVQDPQDIPQTEKLKKSKIALIMSALCIATFLAALDMTIITTALPTITRQFQASQADYNWVGSAYMLAAASATPSWGKISDIFGRKPVLLIANVIFLIGSLLCAVSINIKMLIGSRVVQGIGGGGLLTLVNICISDLFSIRSRSVYFGIIGMVWAFAGVLGPLIGGAMTQYVTWRWCFYINLPIDAVAFVIIFFFLNIDSPKTPLLAGLRALDWLGSITIVGGTVMFLLGLEYGGTTYPWSSAPVICLLVFGVATLGIFMLIQWKISRYPIIPLHLFSTRSTIAAFGTGFVHGFLYTSGTYFLPLYFQAVLGSTPLQSGIYLFPTVISVSIVSAAVGIVIRKTGHYLPVLCGGMAVMVLGHGLYIDLPPHANWAKIILYQIVAGIGIGPNFQSPLIALQSHINPSDVASATATLAFCRNLANSIAVVLGGVVFQNQMQSNLADLRPILSPETFSMLEGKSAGAATELVKALPENERLPVATAYTESLKIMWIFYTAVGAIGFITSLFIQRQKLGKNHQITKTGLDVQEKDRRERLERKKQKEDARKAGNTEKEEQKIAAA